MTSKAKTIPVAAAAALALLCALPTGARAAAVSSQDVAWTEAVILASVSSDLVSRPAVTFRSPAEAGAGTEITEYLAEVNEVWLYRDDPGGCHCLLIHQFLHAIYHQTRSGEGSPDGAAPADAEEWVTARMGWRSSSNACRLSPHPHYPAVPLERSASLNGAGGSRSER